MPPLTWQTLHVGHWVRYPSIAAPEGQKLQSMWGEGHRLTCHLGVSMLPPGMEPSAYSSKRLLYPSGGYAHGSRSRSIWLPTLSQESTPEPRIYSQFQDDCMLVEAGQHKSVHASTLLALGWSVISAYSTPTALYSKPL